MLHTHEVTGSSPVVSTRYDIEDLCNGSTPDSDSVCGGSNPSSSARSTVVVRLQWTFFASRALRFHRSALDALFDCRAVVQQQRAVEEQHVLTVEAVSYTHLDVYKRQG